MNGWLVFLALLAGYLGLVALLRRRQATKPLPGNFEVQGPFILWRTQFGKKAIQKVAKPRRFWNVVADAGIVLTWMIGLAVFALLIFSIVPYVVTPKEAAEAAPEAQFLIGLPGLNPLIPIGYGLVALVLALVIHEGSHGVMAYAARMRVKSLGLLFFILPMGAFVEPDEEDLERSTAREKNRVFAAGPTSNIVLAVVAGSILSFGFVGAMEVANDGQGVAIGTVEEGSAADLAGLQRGDVLTHLDGTPIPSRASYTETINATWAGQQVTLRFLRGGTPMQTEAVLGDKYEYLARVAPDTNKDEYKGKGFLGVAGIDVATMETIRETLQHPFGSVGAFFLYISYPFIVFFQSVDILAPPFTTMFTITGPLAALPPAIFYGTATLLYWIVWINVMLGTFNALPAGPLDGGQMFRATLRERLMRRYRVDPAKVHVERADLGHLQLRGGDEETQRKLDRIQVVVRKATMSVGFFILALILLPLVGPPVINFFL